jgi:hypothetical protein
VPLLFANDRDIVHSHDCSRGAKSRVRARSNARARWRGVYHQRNPLHTIFFFLLRRLTKLVCLCQREGERESLTKLVYMCVSRKTGKPPVTTPQRLVTTVETGLKF